MKQHWWNHETSEVGETIMIFVTIIAYFSSGIHFHLSGAQLWLSTIIPGVLTGIIFNLIAHYRGTKKIYWLDFLSLPW